MLLITIYLSCVSVVPFDPGGGPSQVTGIVINEVDLSIPDAIEILNTGNTMVILAGWTIRAGDNIRVQNFLLPIIEILPGEYLLFLEGNGFSVDTVQFLGTSIQGFTNINWSNSTAGAVELLDRDGQTVDYIAWGNYPDMNTSPLNWSGPSFPIPSSGSSVGRDIHSTDTNTTKDIIPLINTPGRKNDSHPIFLKTTLALGVNGAEYSDSIIIVGPAGPFLFELVSGILPEGLSLETDGTVRGFIAQAGEFSFIVRVKDSQSPPKPAIATISITVLGGAK